MVIDDEMQESVCRPRLADQAARTSTPPWWMVRPGELAARYEFDEDLLMDDIDPDGIPDWQLALAIQAISVCQEARQRPT